MYSYISQLLKKDARELRETIMRNRLIKWRRGPSIVRVERPTRLDRARRLGYKAKQGVVVVRVRVRRGPFNRRRPDSGRRPKRMGVYGITAWKSWQQVAEERAARRYPNMEVVGSYWVADDGIYRYFEVILVDPNAPTIKSDPDYAWLYGKVDVRRRRRRLLERQKKTIEYLRKKLLPELEKSGL